MSNIDMKYEENKTKYLELMAECAAADQEIEAAKNVLAQKERHKSHVEDNIKALLPKGYWFTYDIDTNWKHPKKYSVKKVSCGRNVYVTVKEVFKKKPWPTFTGEHVYTLEEFVKLNIYKTPEEATDGYVHRICPKCGEFMGYSSRSWCNKCMANRRIVAEEFEKTHYYYVPEKESCYYIGYEDELSDPYHRGFFGRSFTLRRLDTGEIIHTNNLWSAGCSKDCEKLPHVEFIKDEENN